MNDITKPVVQESAGYDNYMDANVRKNDSYSVSLDRFFDEPMDVFYRTTQRLRSPLSLMYGSLSMYTSRLRTTWQNSVKRSTR